MAREAVGLGLAMERFGAKFFANDTKSGGFIQYPGRLGPQAQQNLQESLDEQGGLSNAHRVKVLEEGAKFVQTTIPPEDAQFLGSREFQIAEIARIYNVPLWMIQSHEKTTSWGSGIEQMGLGFVRYTLQPWLVRWEQEANRKLFTRQEREAGYFVKFNVSALERGDTSARINYYASGIQNGWLNRNEARAKEEMNEEDGLGEFLEPRNMQPQGGEETTDE
jgi:HK97 family phage portal protein